MQTTLTQTNGANPDVIECLANLSSDEVFTPPAVVASMLDLLPQSLFTDPNTTILDPAVKSGIFLREAAKRFIKGEEAAIPDLKSRVEHIMRHQLFGIALTELTALTGRRTLYCSAHAAGKYSVCRFADDAGNIRYTQTKHTFKNGKCIYCGAAEAAWGQAARGGREAHAYEFIHSDKWLAASGKEDDMHFDVVVGNPPYQMSDGGAQASAMPIYQHFVEAAKALNPRYISMIMPARWYAGGKGLDEFRARMLHDRRIRVLHDYTDGSECFPSVEIKGGVCYFLWDREYEGDCEIFHHEGGEVEHSVRPLVEQGDEIFIRRNMLLALKHKVLAFGEKSFMSIVSSRKPYGICGDVFMDTEKYGLPPMSKEPIEDGYTVYGLNNLKRECRYITRDYPLPKKDMIDDYKIFMTRNWGFGNIGDTFSPPIKAKPGDVCTETFVQFGPFNSEEEMQNAYSYIHTKFFRAMVAIRKQDQGAAKAVYQFVPLQDFSPASPIDWTQGTADVDKALYDKYGLSPEEQDFIKGMVREM